MSIGHQPPVDSMTGLMRSSYPAPGAVPPSSAGDPAWEIATLFPAQGAWTEDDFLELDRNTNRPMELVDGCIRMLPMPTLEHQRILRYLFQQFNAHVAGNELGEILFAPLPVRVDRENYREPDLLFLRPGRTIRPSGHPQGADLALEIVSDDPKDRVRDIEVKPIVYAEAGIPEYWIVDPKTETITVLTLSGARYTEHGVFATGQQATSFALPGFAVSVRDVFAAARA